MKLGFSLLEGLFDGVLVIDKDLRVVYANRSAKEFFGESLEGKSCRGLFSICEHCPFEYVKEEGEGVQVYDTTSKSSKHLCWSMSPLYEGDEFIGVIEIFKDVSNVVHCIVEAERQRTYKETILNSIVEAILVLDPEGKVVEHNKVASRMLCREEDESLVGRHIKDLINLSLEELPPEGERSDIFVETPCGKQKASLLMSPMSSGFGYVVSLYVLKDMVLCELEEESIITRSPAFQKVLDTAKTVSEYDVNILIEGETGTGKSLLAKYIHYLSPRRDGPFIKVNCAAIPESLLEAELFGYVKGAFTGAMRDKPGKVELAEGGTLFLDEIGDMPLHLQAKILHLVQEKEFERLGDTKTRRANVRIIASTNKNLRELIKQGQFREDLYYRLSVVKLLLPPLRERREDIPALVNYFIEKYSRKYSRKIRGISPEAMRTLLSYNFPGNVRELENIIEHAVITCRGTLIKQEDLQIEVENNSVEMVEERERIRKVLEETGGNKSLAAKILGMHRTTLWRKLKEYGIG
ncbi:MAG: sigma 54-interacting transcriptional regulator [Pyrobaculum arsenaticum]|uniref:sigma 54-interacting transcriptional regulator n=1 Tax=Pyrobaculum arsenaticum TaxID=121277 RepID=UPI000ED2B53A|nr:sigma 54-interacting transcriptional regulator [Pyrobaculum arsenaticum]MDM7266487.1 sigma 54-interacting transcriptional regulator [Aquificaceae bacterium]HCO39761.1 sigma-54-dependent Fis family transcriptional regulator [Aquificaceae bacterium]